MSKRIIGGNPMKSIGNVKNRTSHALLTQPSYHDAKPVAVRGSERLFRPPFGLFPRLSSLAIKSTPIKLPEVQKANGSQTINWTLRSQKLRRIQTNLPEDSHISAFNLCLLLRMLLTDIQPNIVVILCSLPFAPKFKH